jgi:hypothetical protein
MHKSVKLTIKTRSGREISEHHTNKEAAELALFTYFKQGVDILSYEVKPESAIAKLDDAIKCAVQAYGAIK